LVETGLHLRFDRLVVVHCDPEEQLRRLMARDGRSRAEAEARVAAQLPLSEKRRFAHIQIDTSGPIAATQAAAGDLAGRLFEEARRPAERLLASAQTLGERIRAGARSIEDLSAAAGLLDGIVAAESLEMPRVAQLARGRGGT